MRSSATHRPFRELRNVFGIALLIWFSLGLSGPGALASPPWIPLPAPVYTFDVNSPNVIDGTYNARDGLFEGTSVLPGTALGLNDIEDDIDALAFPAMMPIAGDSIAVLFSVSRSTQGAVGPDPLLVQLGVPFNAGDQAFRGQAAGDQFMSTTLRGLDGTTKTRGRSSNNTLVRNNFNEGGTSFSADPPSHAQDNAGAASEDNVNGTSQTSAKAGRDPVIEMVYFSLSRFSPSLLTLPGGSVPSGAHVFFNPFPLDPFEPTETQMYAQSGALFLMQQDDIDGLVVLDGNMPGVYDQGDVILFSLAPGSPSLGQIPGASPDAPAADVYIVEYGFPPSTFMRADELGLGALGDNVDALDFIVCNDAVICAEEHGIRSFPGDMNCDHVVDFADINPFVLALVDGPAIYSAVFPDCNWYNADIDGDTTVGFGDINPFVALLIP